MGIDVGSRRARRGLSTRLLSAALRPLSRKGRAENWCSYARWLMRRRRPSWALSLCRRACTLAPGDLRHWRYRAAAAVRSGRLDEAGLCYRTMARLDPRNPRAHARLAGLYELLGAPEAARRVCLDAVCNLPDAACLHRMLGRIFLNLGSIEDALRALHRAAELNPFHCDTQYYVALALRRANRADDARRALRRALALRPDDPKLYYALGLCCSPDRAERDALGLLLEGLALEELATKLVPPRWPERPD